MKKPVAHVCGEVVLMVAVVVGCSRRIPRDDAGVYGAVVASAYQDRARPDTIVVADSTVSFDATAAIGERTAAPAGMRTELAEASTKHALIRALSFPFPVQFMSERDAKVRARTALGGLQIFAFTPVVYSPDRRQAFLYYEVWCGDLCGWGAEALLEGSAGHWVIKKQVAHWER
jgi:hypothetical protein